MWLIYLPIRHIVLAGFVIVWDMSLINNLIVISPDRWYLPGRRRGIKMTMHMKYIIKTTFFSLCILLAFCNSYAEEHAIVQSQNGLVLRDGPNQKSNKIIVIPNNTEVFISGFSDKEEVITGISAKWAHVKYGNLVGWVFGGYLNYFDYMLIPQKIIPKQFTSLDASFNCNGRSWHFDNESKPKIIGNIFFIYIKKDFTMSTAPGELNEKPIIISGKKNIVFLFEKKQDKHIIIKAQIISNNFKYYNYKIDACNKSEIKIPLPTEGETINNFQVGFFAEKCSLGIKLIYIE